MDVNEPPIPGAQWVNGLWYFQGRPILIAQPETAADRKAKAEAEHAAAEAAATKGLPPGHRRFGSLVMRQTAGGYSVAKFREEGIVDTAMGDQKATDKLRAKRISMNQSAQDDLRNAIKAREAAEREHAKAVAAADAARTWGVS